MAKLGKPIREFIHSNDLAEAIFTCPEGFRFKLKTIFKNKLPIINVGTGENIKINILAKMISKFSNFEGTIKFDKRSPDGVYKKNLDSKVIKKLGWRPKVKLKSGLKQVVLSKL